MHTPPLSRNDRPAACPPTRARRIRLEPEFRDGDVEFWERMGSASTMLNIGLSVADVAADVLVALELYHRGLWLWCALVCCSLLISNTIYCMIGTAELFPTLVAHLSQKLKCRAPKFKLTKTLKNGRRKYRTSTPVQSFALFLIGFPFGQLVPIGDLIFQHFFRDEESSASSWDVPFPVEESEGLDLPNRPSKIVNDQVRLNLKRGLAGIRSLTNGVGEHIRTHCMLYVEVVVESIPQAAIQLLAMSLHDEVTEIQLVSLMLSIFSIATKANTLAGLCSFTTPMLWFLKLCCAHDVFNFFYAYSTILSNTEPPEVPLPIIGYSNNGVRISFASACFITKLQVNYVVGIAAPLAFGVFVIADYGWLRWKAQITPKGVAEFLLACFVYCSLLVPALLLLDMLKLSALALCLLGLCRSACDTCGLGMWAYFIESAANPEEKNCRYRWIAAASSSPISELREEFNETLLNPPGSPRILCFLKHAVKAAIQKMRSEQLSFFPRPGSVCYPELLGILSLMVVFFVNVCVNLTFPVWHFARYWDRCNPIQIMCFSGLVGTLPLLGMLWSRYREATRVALLVWVSKAFRSGYSNSFIVSMINSYFESPARLFLEGVLERAVEEGLLPLELLGDIGRYMTSDDFSGLSMHDLRIAAALRSMENAPRQGKTAT